MKDERMYTVEREKKDTTYPRGAAGGRTGMGRLGTEPLHDGHADVEDIACEPFRHGDLGGRAQGVSEAHSNVVDPHLGDETLFNDEITNVEWTVTAPTKADEALSSGVVDEAMLDQEGTNRLEYFGKERCSIDLFLKDAEQ